MAISEARKKELDAIITQKQSSGGLSDERKKFLDSRLASFSGISSASPEQMAAMPQSKVGNVAKKLAPKSVEGFGETLGTAAAVAGGVTNKINQSSVSEADARFKLAKLLNDPKTTPEQKVRIRQQLDQVSNVGTAQQQLPALSKTGKQVAAEGLGILGTAALGAAPGASGLARVGMGAALGAGTGLKTGLEENLSAKDTAKKIGIGTAIGIGTGLAAEGVGALWKAGISHFKPGAVLNREFPPPTKAMVNDIEKGLKTFGDKAAEVTDETGKQLYQGSPKQILDKARGDIKTQGEALLERVKSLDGKFTVNKSDITKPVFQQIQDEFGALSEHEAKVIRSEFGRINKQVLTPEDLLSFKRQIDEKIPDTIWAGVNAGDRIQNIATYTKYLLRTGLKDMLNEKSQDATIQALNNRLSIGMDMRRLAAIRLQKAATAALPGLGQMINRIFEKTITSPSVTTRVAPILSKIPKVPTSVVRTGLTELLSK